MTQNNGTKVTQGPEVGRDLLFEGEGEMRARCRDFDWSQTSLGATNIWSRQLRNTVRMMMASKWPMFLWWGPELIQIFNDAYKPSFGNGGRDLIALGAKGQEHWEEIWPIIGPQIESVMEHGEASWHEDQLVPIFRNGQMEDVYWTYGYSAVFEDDGSIGGTLVICQETTERIRVTNELNEVRNKLNKTLEELQNSHWHIRRDKETLPICMGCARVHVSDDQWVDLVAFLNRSATFLSHDYCPPCAADVLEKLEDSEKQKGR